MYAFGLVSPRAIAPSSSRLRASLVLALAGTCVFAAPSAHSASPSNGWTAVRTPTTATLRAVSCPADKICYAGGDGGVILGTKDGGRTWQIQQASSTGVQGGLTGIACTSATVCFAVGSATVTQGGNGSTRRGLFASTKNGGKSWATESADLAFYSIACPSAATCFIGADYGGVVLTTDGGRTWNTQSTPLTEDVKAQADPNSSWISVGLYGVACPTTQLCYAVGSTVGDTGAILGSGNAGRGWQAVQQSTDILRGITCPSSAMCLAIGDAWDVHITTDSGRTWTNPSIEAAEFYGLKAIACRNTKECYAVGNYSHPGRLGAIFATADGGRTWTRQQGATPTNALYGISCRPVGTCIAVGAGTVLRRG